MGFNIINKIIDWLKNVFGVRQKTKSQLGFKKSDEREQAVIQDPKTDLQKYQLVKMPLQGEDGDIRCEEELKEFDETLKEKRTEEKTETGKFSNVVFSDKKVKEKLIEEKQEGSREEKEKREVREKTYRKTSEREKDGRKKSKPYKKKSPTEPVRVIKETTDKRQKAPILRQKEIDLGKRRQAKRSKKSSISETIPGKKREKKDSVTSARVVAPFVEVDLDEARVFLVIPRQSLESTTEGILQKQLNYMIKLNGEEKILPISTVGMGRYLEIAEKRIELGEPLQKFEVIYPLELGEKVYRYKHLNDFIYVFVAIGNNLGRMHYLYDLDGNVNPLPQKEVWILLNEDFELAIEPDMIEDTWIWENYRLFYVNLKKVNKLVIIHRTTNKKEVIPCESTFSVDSEAVVYDDFGRQSPIFTGNSIEIRAPIVNEEGWRVWIQNKQAGYRIVSDNWSGKEPLKLNFDHDLPCECGEFQVDICGQDEEPVTTLFFRYVPSLQLNYPREIIVPSSQHGHRAECIEVVLGSDFQEWELKVHGKIEPFENSYQIELPPEQDTLSFSISQKNKPETEVRFQITIPRVKWKISNHETWSDRPLQIKREELMPGCGLYLIVFAGGVAGKHNLLAILKSNSQKLQEGKFSKKGMNYLLYLNEFSETIVNNSSKLTLTVGIDNKLWFDAIYFPPDLNRLKEILNLLNSFGFVDIPDYETMLVQDYEKAEGIIQEKLKDLKEVCEYIVEKSKNEEYLTLLKQAHESSNQNNLIDLIKKYHEIITKFRDEMNKNFKTLNDEIEKERVEKKFFSNFYNKYLKQDILKMKEIRSKRLIHIMDIQIFYESYNRISEEIRIIKHRRYDDFWIRFVSDMKNPGNIQYLVKKWKYFKERDGNLNNIDKDFDEKYVFEPLGENEEIKKAILKFFIPKSLNELNLYDRLRFLDLSEKDKELAIRDANRFFGKILKLKKEIQIELEMNENGDGSS